MKNLSESVLVVDFGSQFTLLIARRIREMGVHAEIVPCHSALEAFERIKPKALILSGSPHSTLAEESPILAEELFKQNLPILGICYGQQVMCKQLGGKIQSTDKREFGRSFLTVVDACSLFRDVWKKGEEYPVWMSHADYVSAIPEGFKVVGVSLGSPFAAIADEIRKFYGLQFHPEVVHTPEGGKILENFVYHIAGIEPCWKMSTYREKAVQTIRETVGDAKVLCALSGGVDSSVVALLIHEAIGENLICILVDNGMMRKNEAKEILSMFKMYHNLPLFFIDAGDKFLNALSGVSDPETKRKIIGKLFIEVFEEEAKNHEGISFLAQGTLYPDVIESVSFSGGPSAVIKSHHNVGGLPESMNLKLLEPIRDLFKDEVRLLGKELGLSEKFISRHPFPGPGLAVRCLGDITLEKLNILREVDSIYLEEIHKNGLYEKIWQAFAVLLPVRSVGVMGDARTYEFVCSLRAVTSLDGMTADFYPFDMDFLANVSIRIINEVKGINRVVYDITSKPPGTIEWE